MRGKTRHFWVGLAALGVGLSLSAPGMSAAGAVEFSLSNKAPEGYAPAGVSAALIGIVIPDGAIPEGEPNCYENYVDVTNGGCNSDPAVFGALSCGDILSGTSGTYYCDGGDCGDEGNYRDTDWFQVVVDRKTVIIMTGMADFPVQFLIIDGNSGCADPVILNGAWGNAGVETRVWADVDPGTYYLWAGPDVFADIPCGSNYYFKYTCDPRDVPTVSFWGLLILAIATAGSSLWMIRRRKKTA